MCFYILKVYVFLERFGLTDTVVIKSVFIIFYY